MKFQNNSRSLASFICISTLILLSLCSISKAAIQNCSLERESTWDDPSKQVCEYCTSSTAGRSSKDWTCVANAASTTETWKTEGCMEYGPSPISPNDPAQMECLRCDCKQTLDVGDKKCYDSVIAHCAKHKKVGTDTLCQHCRHGWDHKLPSEDYGLGSDSKSCINNSDEGKIPHCWQYLAGDTPKCEKCHQNWILNNDATATGSNVCLKIPQTQNHFNLSCLKASFETSTSTNLQCDVCKDATYRLGKIQKVCSNVIIPNCKTYAFSDECTECLDNTFYLSTDQTICQKIANCQVQSAYDVCTTCSAGFTKSGDNKSCFQQTLDASCSNQSSTDTNCSCTTAGEILTWDKKQCITKPVNVDNCVRLSPSQKGCGECSAGFILTISSNMSEWKCIAKPSSTSIKHADDNCQVAFPSLDASNANTITHCRMCQNPSGPLTIIKDSWDNQYPQIYDQFFKLGEDYRCYSRKNLGPGCPVWAIKSDQECMYCNSGFYLNKDQRCVPLPKAINKWCDSIGAVSETDKTIECKTCKNGYALQADQTCQLNGTTPIAKCSHYEANEFQCMHCMDGFVLTADQLKCIQEIEHCLQYDQVNSSSTDSTCSECMTCHGKALSGDQKWCINVSSHGCEEFDVNNMKCVRCANKRRNGWTYDFYLDSNGECKPNTGQVSNCETYDANGVCTKCYKGSITTPASGAITKCDRDINNCEVWELDSDSDNKFQCNQCLTGSTLNSDQTFCTPSLANCQTSKPGDTTRCIECNATYFLKTGYTPGDKSATECIKPTNAPVTGTGVCIAIDASDKCIQCESGKTLKTGQTECITIPNCQVHIDDQENACRECNTDFFLKSYDSTNDFGTSCVSKTTFDADIQDANLLGKHQNNKCLAYLSNGDCDRCMDEYVLVQIPSKSPICDKKIDGCKIYQMDGTNYRCLQCVAAKAVTGWDPAKESGSACVDSTGNVGGECLVSDGGTSAQCLQCKSTKYLKTDGTCGTLPAGCKTPEKYVAEKCSECDSTHVLRMDSTQTYGECISKTTTDTATGIVKNIDKLVYNRVPNCVEYETTGQCRQCSTNFKVDSLAGAQPLCIPMTNIGNCASHDAQGKCLKCNTAFQPTADQLGCEGGIADCQDHDASGQCIKCIIGKQPATNQLTCQTGIANCQTLSGDYLKCKECVSGYFVVNFNTATLDGDSCSNTSPKTNCFGEDNSSPTKCNRCTSGFKLVADACSTADDCTDFNSDQTQCFQCKAPKILNNYSSVNGGDCVAQPTTEIAGCYIYQDDTHCVGTLDTHTLPTTGDDPAGYTAVKTIANCKIHNANEDLGCKECNATYQISGKQCVLDSDQDLAITGVYAHTLRPADCTGFDSTSGKCIQCGNGKKPNSDTLPSCIDGGIANCDIYNSEFTNCWKCKNTFILTGFVEVTDLGTACASNSGPEIINCQAKDGSNKCKRCANGYTIKSSDGSCINDNTLNCLSFSPQKMQRCNSCPDTHFLKSDDNTQSLFGVCKARSSADTEVDSKYLPYYTDCTGYAASFKCGKCVIGQSLQTTDNLCSTPPTTNCREHGATDCTKCFSGYELSGTSCNLVNTGNSNNANSQLLANCAMYDNNKCSKCLEPYQPTLSGTEVTKCIYTTLTQCIKQADTNDGDTTCDSCISGYLKSGTPAVCSKCSLNKRFENNACTANDQIPNCTASNDDHRTCQTCATGFLPNWSKSECKQTILNCEYLTQDGTLCAQCKPNFIRSALQTLGQDGAKVGEKCHPVVSNCVNYDTDGNCTKCFLPKYYLADSSTTPVQKICVETKVDYCIENKTGDTTCPDCCNQCMSGFGLFAWKEGTLTRHACVFNSLTCGQANCQTYKSFNDWHNSQCDVSEPITNPGSGTSTSSTTTGSPSITITPQDTVNANIISTFAGLVIVTLLQLIAF